MKTTISPSSLISQFAYDELGQVVHIWFRRGGHYSYNEFPPEKFAAFREAESHGKFFLGEIKPNHQFSKHDDTDTKN